MAKAKNKLYQLKKSKIKKICVDHGFWNNVSVKDEDGRAVETYYGDLKQTLVKYISIDLNTPLIQGFIKTYYEDKDLIKKIKNDPVIKEDLENAHVKYDENDKLIIDEVLEEDLTNWCLCVDAEDMLLYLYKEGLPCGYYNAETIYKYCKEEIDKLMEDKIFKLIPVPKEISGE